MATRAPSPILVVGSVALDTVRTPHGQARDALGGSALYFSIAASYFSPVRLVGVVGQDFPADGYAVLEARRVDVAGLSRVEGKTFAWAAEYSPDLSERTTLRTDLNVFEYYHPRIPREYRGSPFVFLANIHPELQLEVLDQIQAPRLVVCDTMNLWIDFARADLLKVLSRVDVAFFNADEARQITGEGNLLRAASAIRRIGPKRVIVKKGEHGVFMASEEGTFSLPAYPLEVVCDPTGAGDVFAGGAVGFLARQDRFDDAACRRSLLYGTVMASFAVEGFSIERIRALHPDRIRERFRLLVEHARVPSPEDHPDDLLPPS